MGETGKAELGAGVCAAGVVSGSGDVIAGVGLSVTSGWIGSLVPQAVMERMMISKNMPAINTAKTLINISRVLALFFLFFWPMLLSCPFIHACTGCASLFLYSVIISRKREIALSGLNIIVNFILHASFGFFTDALSAVAALSVFGAICANTGRQALNQLGMLNVIARPACNALFRA